MDLSKLYLPKKSREASDYIMQARDAAFSKKDGAATFDSMASAEFISDSENRDNAKLPAELKQIFSEIDVLPDEAATLDSFDNPSDELSAKQHLKNKVVSVTLDAVNEYEAMHGEAPSPDVIAHALHVGASVTTDSMRQNSQHFERSTLDGLESMYSEPYSMNPNRPVVTIYQSITEAIPFAHMLPADIKSNEAPLIIVGHRAASDFGTYSESDNMDGINSGGVYMSSSRIHELENASGTWGGKLTAQSVDAEHCDPDGDEVKWLRGRGKVYVNGLPVGGEVSSEGSGQSVLSGKATVAGTEHILGGTINTDTGVVAASFTPALPSAAKVHVEGFIDFERSKGKTPVFKTDTAKFVLYAKPFRARTEQSIDAVTQFQNELSINPQSESLIALRAHYSNERHYDALRKLMRIGAMNDPKQFEFDWAGQKAYKNYSDIWENFYGGVWGAACQEVAEATNDHGLSYMYVGKHLLARMKGSSNFRSSGVKVRPGIYRAGTLNGDIQVYYSPYVVNEDIANGTSRALAIGKSSQVARNPIVMGDAVAPIVENVSVNTDHERGMVYYARNYLDINPHAQSAMGCKVIEFTGLK